MRNRFFLVLPLALSLFQVGASARQAEASSPADQKSKTSGKNDASKPSAQDIANAKSQGLVWVDTGGRVYHKSGEFYGKTKHGKFVTEDTAKKEGFSEAPQPEPPKKGKKQRDQSGLDSTIDTHSSTPPKH